MGDEIRLPRSGIVLTRTEYGTFENETALYCEKAPFYTATCQGQIHSDASRDECIAWLDSRVLELRAALMPADARERIARALRDTEVRIPPKHRGPVEAWYPRADAILSALAGDVTPRPEPEPPHGGEEAR